MDYKILSANSATGITREGKPWTKVNLLLQRTDNNEQENVIAWGSESIPLVNMVGQIVSGSCFQGKPFKGKTDIIFKWSGAVKQPQPQQSNDVVIKKLDEILSILHANFPTSLDLVDDKDLSFSDADI